MQAPKPGIRWHSLERWLSFLGVAYAMITSIGIWGITASYQPTWPLPGLYFLELAVLSLVCAYLYFRGHPRRSVVAWAVAGVFLAFSILAGFSVGFFFLPVALTLVLVSILSDVRSRQPILVHLGIFLFAGIAQAALILVVARLAFPQAPTVM